MIEKLLLNLRGRGRLSPASEQALRDVIVESSNVAAKEIVVRHAVPLDRSILLIEGLICRYKDLSNGRRQISALYVAGDFLDLPAFVLGYIDHDVMALSDCTIAFAPFEGLQDLVEGSERMTRLLWRLTCVDAAIHRAWVLSLGQQSGPQRAAHLFCELYTRLELVALTRGAHFDLPLNQVELGECLGLTVVHTNRVLRELRELGLISFGRGTVTILDWEKLVLFAEFDPSYLYLDRRTDLSLQMG